MRCPVSVEEPNAVLDLTVLLTTGRISESVSDFLGSGEHMSERVSVSPFCSTKQSPMALE